MKQKYEYWFIRHLGSSPLQDHEDSVNKKAKEGWEAVNLAVTVDTDFDEVYTTLMKREKSHFFSTGDQSVRRKTEYLLKLDHFASQGFDKLRKSQDEFEKSLDNL